MGWPGLVPGACARTGQIVREHVVLWKPLTGVAIVVAMLFAVASATSLGSFDDVALSAVAEPVDTCTAATTNFYDESGTLIEALLQLAGTDVGSIGLDGLEGDCEGDLRPVVVTIGDGLLSEPAVLSRTPLNQLDQAASDGTELLFPVGEDDELNQLTDSLTVTEVRVAFCSTAPDGSLRCEL